mmetsp:Transcript_27269/g.59883  ORF Transcript_27269/g.59883 Transcript_27269/m.59883 type:complete len:309 (+) Transcript_27269:23-949(+)
MLRSGSQGCATAACRASPSIVVLVVVGGLLHRLLQEGDELVHDDALHVRPLAGQEEVLVLDHVDLPHGHEEAHDGAGAVLRSHRLLLRHRVLQRGEDDVGRRQGVVDLLVERLQNLRPSHDEGLDNLGHGHRLLERSEAGVGARLLHQQRQDGGDVVGRRAVHVPLEAHLQVEVVERVLHVLGVLLFLHPLLDAPLQVLILVAVLVVAALLDLRGIDLRHDDLRLLLREALEHELLQELVALEVGVGNVFLRLPLGLLDGSPLRLALGLRLGLGLAGGRRSPREVVLLALLLAHLRQLLGRFLLHGCS